ncbi:hypothetical protein SH1V18_07880 [Vallitalea longa]|uniref:Uncharacterized protein n=1 Tax=Vallitalea longa TaxID=2936439 RepID=A0A9W6DEC9_9FIRM|nr:hypothetical protein [Vallitalea longa]GKX28308.1 hypothetical protein SH1V18_07880 [Vallitalea longa]
MLLDNFIEKAKKGEPVYITDVRNGFQELDKNNRLEFVLLLRRLDKDIDQQFKLYIPSDEDMKKEDKNFVNSYVYAEIYNILSSLGGKYIKVYVDKTNKKLMDLASSLNEVFQINETRKDRKGYGRCINVIDRMLGASLYKDDFRFMVEDIKDLPKQDDKEDKQTLNVDIFKKVEEDLDGKIICGMDIGGTDIKVAMVSDGDITCFKEYDWFPASFIESSQLIEPICLLVRLVKIKSAFDIDTSLDSNVKEELSQLIEKAMEKDASYEFMKEVVEKVEKSVNKDLVELDAIGVCFPDVVVKDKIVGGEVYKTRGIRNNSNINYEEDFLKLTHLNKRLEEICKDGGAVKITNDGPMASFTAAVEMVAGGKEDVVENGVYAHTLGTELGTGWIDSEGKIPEIPLENYNFIIDLGSYHEKEFEPDDLRSINNFNTELSGTLQKFTSQSGVFRLAMKYFPEKRPDLYQEMFDKGFVVEREVDGEKGFYVPTEPVDMRKPFLEHLMSLPERENDETCKRIFREIGESLAITWFETEKIMLPRAKSRILFGRLVKNDYCFRLMCEGAKQRKEDIVFEVADGGMAYTRLMKQLEDDAHFTVAQFAQAVGAIYYGNLGLIDNK